jgi:hypothetical protein
MDIRPTRSDFLHPQGARQLTRFICANVGLELTLQKYNSVFFKKRKKHKKKL